MERLLCAETERESACYGDGGWGVRGVCFGGGKEGRRKGDEEREEGGGGREVKRREGRGQEGQEGA